MSLAIGKSHNENSNLGDTLNSRIQLRSATADGCVARKFFSFVECNGVTEVLEKY